MDGRSVFRTVRQVIAAIVWGLAIAFLVWFLFIAICTSIGPIVGLVLDMTLREFRRTVTENQIRMTAGFAAVMLAAATIRAAVSGLNRLDDPRHAKRPPDAP